MRRTLKKKAVWSYGCALLFLFSVGCPEQEAAKDAAHQADQGPAPEADLGGPEVADVNEKDSGVWTWDEEQLGQPCEGIYDDCGAGNICLADITCNDHPEGWLCERHEEANPSYYKCQRKCTADEHCLNRVGQRCVAKLVGDGETDQANLCISACLPADAANSITLEDCRSRQEASRFSTWPPLP